MKKSVLLECAKMRSLTERMNYCEKHGSVMNEISSNLYQKVSQKFYNDYKDNRDNLETDKFGNPMDSKGRLMADRLRNTTQNYNYLKDRENDEDPLAQEAKSVWKDNDLESQIEWSGNEWEGDETYGPDFGYVDFDGWQFEIEGSIDGPEQEPEFNEVTFTSPDGEEGSFNVAGNAEMAPNVKPVDDKYRK